MTIPMGVNIGGYIGKYGQLPAALCRPISDQLGPRSVSVSLDWKGVYNAPTQDPIAVQVDLVGAAVQNQLDGIRSVYVDNTFSDIIIYVYFPDTNFTLVVPAGAIVWQPVITAALKAIVYTQNFGTDIPTTVIHFCNFAVQGFYIPATQSGAAANPVTLVTTDIKTFASTGNVNQLVNIGAPSADRLIIVALEITGRVGANPAIPTPAAVTLGGIAMNLMGSAGLANITGTVRNLGVFVGIYQLLVPAGASALLAVTQAMATVGMLATVYSLTNYESSVPQDIESTTSGAGNPAATLVVTNAATVGGAAVYGSANYNATQPGWSGNATQRSIFSETGGGLDDMWQSTADDMAIATTGFIQGICTKANALLGITWR